jgi:hypothetical protein
MWIRSNTGTKNNTRTKVTPRKNNMWIRSNTGSKNNTGTKVTPGKNNMRIRSNTGTKNNTGTRRDVGDEKNNIGDKIKHRTSNADSDSYFSFLCSVSPEMFRNKNFDVFGWQ